MTAHESSARVTLDGVTKLYGVVAAVDDITLELEPGTLTTLLGPSGCGKTTLLRLIAGLEMPDSGRVHIGERDVTALSAFQRDVSMVFQAYALFPHMTAGENVGYGLRVQGLPAHQIAARTRSALETVGLGGLEERYIDQLSGGQQQRVAVARALILQPQVMLFDEPLSNIDTKLRRSMREDIHRLQKQTGITSVYVTHDQTEALAVSDRVVVMNHGRVVQYGTPEELYQHPNSEFVATFIGDANILAGDVSRDGNTAVLQLGRTRFPLTGEAPVPGGPVKVAVRPESIRLHSQRGSDLTLEGTVLRRAYVGAATEYTVATDLGELFAVVPAAREQLPAGQRVYLVIDDVGLAVLPPAPPG